jgi:hypothetical protein
MVAHDAVAFATCGFQALSFEDADPSLAARDQSLALERPQDDRHRRAMHAEHHRKEFLFEQEGVLVDTIARLQEPSGAALGNVVQQP